MRRLVLLLVLTALSTSGVSGTAFAQAEIDQANGGSIDGYYEIDSTNHYAQTVTAGKTGKLESVSLYLGPSNNIEGHLLVEIREINDQGVPEGRIRASEGVFAGPTEGWVSLALAHWNINVLSGQRYAIYLHTASGTYYVGKTPDAYPRGVALMWRYDQSPQWVAQEGDVAFKTQVSSYDDSTPPSGSVLINNGERVTDTSAVTLTLEATDNGGSGVEYMRFKNNCAPWSNWRADIFNGGLGYWHYGIGTKLGKNTVYVQYMDAAGNVSPIASDTIILRR